jgi:uncharacterized SAM-binding protein YcdF (DUF218 family)
MPILVSRFRSVGSGLAVGGLVALLVMDLDLTSLVSYWGDRTAFLPLGAALGALVWRTRLRGALVFVSGALAALWLIVAYTPLTRWLAADLARRDTLVEADAVFVFGSRVQADGDPTAQAQSRLLRGVELVAQGRAPRLIVSEIATGARHATLARETLARLGVEGELLVVGPIRNTRDEAVAVAELFRHRGWRRVLSVTSPTHSRRASLALERQGLEVVSVPAVETLFDLESLDRREERLGALGSLLHERVGLVWYRLRGYSR